MVVGGVRRREYATLPLSRARCGARCIGACAGERDGWGASEEASERERERERGGGEDEESVADE